RPPRPLPSFPTRRSSDLTTARISIRLGGGANVCFHGGETVGNLPPATSWSTALNYYGVVPDGTNITVEGIRTFDRGDGVAFGSRSEEHTSELQSLRHLVC